MHSGNVMSECSNSYSTGWFERKLIVVSVVVGSQYMLISRLDVSCIMSRSRKLIYLLFSYVGLSFMSVCIWFMYVLMRSGCVLVVSYTIGISSA